MKMRTRDATVPVLLDSSCGSWLGLGSTRSWCMSNKNRCIEYCCTTDGSLGKGILDHTIGIHQKQPEDHLIPF